MKAVICLVSLVLFAVLVIALPFFGFGAWLAYATNGGVGDALLFAAIAAATFVAFGALTDIIAKALRGRS